MITTQMVSLLRGIVDTEIWFAAPRDMIATQILYAAPRRRLGCKRQSRQSAVAPIAAISTQIL
jgi:hypothetical protein